MPLKLVGIFPDASEYYTVSEIKGLGYEFGAELDKVYALVSFRASVEKQIFPIRILVKKSDVPEDEWASWARQEAKRLIGLLADELK